MVQRGASGEDGAAGTAGRRSASRRPRSDRTRAKLIDAAFAVFRETSFTEAKISDIARLAETAHGTFYTHFQSKEEIFLAVALELHEKALTATSVRAEVRPEATLAERIEATNRRYFELYRRDHRILASLESLSVDNPQIATLQVAGRHIYISRVESAIARWQRQGLVDPELDGPCTAHCLGAMVERVAHMAMVFEDTPGSEEEMVAALTHIWLATLGLERARRDRPTES